MLLRRALPAAHFDRNATTPVTDWCTCVKSHTREQISCFGPDGLLRRHDYTVDILGGATGLNYASEYRDVGGIIVPTKHRVYAYQCDYQLVKEPLLVAIDMREITLL